MSLYFLHLGFEGPVCTTQLPILIGIEGLVPMAHEPVFPCNTHFCVCSEALAAQLQQAELPPHEQGSPPSSREEYERVAAMDRGRRGPSDVSGQLCVNQQIQSRPPHPQAVEEGLGIRLG